MNYCSNTLFGIILVVIPMQTYGQVNLSRFQLDIDLQLLRILHRDNYYYLNGLVGQTGRFPNKLSHQSISYGFCTSLSYRVVPKIQISLGIGYHKIDIHGLTGLNQALLPPDRRSFTKELVLSSKNTYHIAQFPLKVIFNPFQSRRIHTLLTIGLAGQYYFQSHYVAEKYSGPVTKNDFVGWSSFVGIEILVKLSNRLSAKVGYDYILNNPEYVDDILFSQGSKDAGVGTYGIPLTFNYQVFKVGLSRAL